MALPLTTITGVQHAYATVNGIQMHYVTAGSGPPLLLLHGFPEFWYSWRHQIGPLSQHFTVIAPDLRGYNDTEKPSWGYEVDVLVTDVLELMRSLGYAQAHVVGHDWGGMLAWVLAIAYPQRVKKLATLNIPHPALFQEALRNNRRQMLRSWYVGLFQLPWLPEQLIKANDYRMVKQIFRGMAVRKDAFSDEDLEAYKDAMAKPGALTAMLNWYRGLRRPASSALMRDTGMQVNVPTLMIWGEEDAALGKELTYNTGRYVPNLRIHYIPNCSHWVQHEQPEQVNRYLLEFLHADGLHSGF